MVHDNTKKDLLDVLQWVCGIIGGMYQSAIAMRTCINCTNGLENENMGMVDTSQCHNGWVEMVCKLQDYNFVCRGWTCRICIVIVSVYNMIVDNEFCIDLLFYWVIVRKGCPLCEKL